MRKWVTPVSVGEAKTYRTNQNGSEQEGEKSEVLKRGIFKIKSSLWTLYAPTYALKENQRKKAHKYEKVQFGWMCMPVYMQNQLDFLLGQPCADRQSADPRSHYDCFFFNLHLFLLGFNPQLFLCFMDILIFRMEPSTVSLLLYWTLLTSWHSLAFNSLICFYCFWTEPSLLITWIIFCYYFYLWLFQ